MTPQKRKHSLWKSIYGNDVVVVMIIVVIVIVIMVVIVMVTMMVNKHVVII